MSTTPPTNLESAQNKLASLAVDLAMKRLEDGTASSQIISQCLKFATIQAQLELEQAQLQNRLLEAKIKREQETGQILEMQNEVLRALRSYAPPVD